MNEKIGLDFSRVLRALVRQDPDVIMVGEIRDLETASAAIRAAQTGHLVLSTLHSRCAKTALTRLQHTELNSLTYDTVSLILAQRLARRLCDYCKQGIATKTGKNGPFRANPEGCLNCNSGYQGRIGFLNFYRSMKGSATSNNGENYQRPATSTHHSPCSNLRDDALSRSMLVISLAEADCIAPD